jgi:hypothetical protein
MSTINPVSSTTPSGLSGSTNTYKVPGFMPKMLDLSASQDYTPLDPDLQNVILAVQNTDFGAQAQALVLDLIRLLSHIRQQNTQLSYDQATLTLNIAKNVATAQKEQAHQSAIAESVSAGSSGLQSILDGAIAARSIKQYGQTLRQTHAEADSHNWRTSGPQDADGEVAGNQRPASAPPAYSQKDGVPDAPTQAETEAAANPIPAKKGADDGPEADAPERELTPAEKTRRQEWITNEMRNKNMKLELYSRISSAIAGALSASMKGAGTQATIDAGAQQAIATIEQAAMQYMQTQSNQSNEYANEMRDQIAQVLSTIKDIEQARHQANQAIGQIAV